MQKHNLWFLWSAFSIHGVNNKAFQRRDPVCLKCCLSLLYVHFDNLLVPSPSSPQAEAGKLAEENLLHIAIEKWNRWYTCRIGELWGIVVFCSMMFMAYLSFILRIQRVQSDSKAENKNTFLYLLCREWVCSWQASVSNFKRILGIQSKNLVNWGMCMKLGMGNFKGIWN